MVPGHPPAPLPTPHTLLSVVEDHAERVSEAGRDAAHAVAERDAVHAARTTDGPLPRGEDHDLPARERHHLAPRLRPRPLLHEQELAAGEVLDLDP